MSVARYVSATSLSGWRFPSRRCRITLKVLHAAGLLNSQRRASWVYYAVVPDALASLSVLLGVDTVAGVPA